MKKLTLALLCIAAMFIIATPFVFGAIDVEVPTQPKAAADYMWRIQADAAANVDDVVVQTFRQQMYLDDKGALIRVDPTTSYQVSFRVGDETEPVKLANGKTVTAGEMVEAANLFSDRRALSLKEKAKQ